MRTKAGSRFDARRMMASTLVAGNPASGQPPSFRRAVSPFLLGGGAVPRSLKRGRPARCRSSLRPGRKRRDRRGMVNGPASAGHSRSGGAAVAPSSGLDRSRYPAAPPAVFCRVWSCQPWARLWNKARKAARQSGLARSRWPLPVLSRDGSGNPAPEWQSSEGSVQDWPCGAASCRFGPGPSQGSRSIPALPPQL
jgi:hypothetical protein